MESRTARAERRPKKRERSTAPAVSSRRVPYFEIVAIALTAAALIGLFSTEIADSDFWWHLKTGQYIFEQRSLPVPDPFNYTTALNPAEGPVQHFNLTHEWLSQVALYLTYLAGGFPAVVIGRALLLTLFCGISGFLAFRTSGSFLAGIAAAFGTASVAVEFTADRPAIVSFLGVAVFVAVLEQRRSLWLLPPLALLWANCHGGFFLGWVVLAAYCAELRAADLRRVWRVAACSIAVSFLNPNGYGVLTTLLRYRQSELQKNLIEWHPPSLWGPPYGFDILLYASAAVLILSWKRVRTAHWILFAAFAGASLMAFRNIPLIGFLAPVSDRRLFSLSVPCSASISMGGPGAGRRDTRHRPGTRIVVSIALRHVDHSRIGRRLRAREPSHGTAVQHLRAGWIPDLAIGSQRARFCGRPRLERTQLSRRSHDSV